MSAAIHYAVKAKLIRRKKDDGELDFLEVDKDFFNENPILAREAAFKFYQNYIDVLLESKGLRYESDKQAREALETFHDPKTSTRITIMGKSFDYPDSFGNGIGVFIVVDVPSESKEHDLTYADNLALIHGIGFLEDSDSPESILTGLEHEIFYYNLHGYNKEDCESTITFCNPYEWLEGYREDEPGTYTILKTPFDWTGMDEPYWWGECEAEEEKVEPYQSQTYEEIIADGETDQVEFKPALLYNFKTKNAGIGVKGIIAKSICGFLNAKGGLLFIGISDKGKPQGLSYDFSLAEDENSKDYFRLQFDDTIKQFLPISIKDKISGEFITVDGIEVFVIIVFPSKRGPVFMNGQHGKEFWVRWTASTRQYTDIEEITSYCLEHWNKKDKNNE
jgi:hypothetical protein